MHPGKVHFQARLIEKLQNRLVETVRLFLRSIAIHPPTLVLAEMREHLQESQDLVKELEGNKIRAEAGGAAAREFYTNYRLRCTNAPLFLKSTIERIKAKRGREDDAIDRTVNLAGEDVVAVAEMILGVEVVVVVGRNKGMKLRSPNSVF